ncbi:unnamed protein product [Thlaspi arvense]|uniref:KIB1-4 beta-propeller domain-containing protein n=1 Tax=Thlaspi arvense TaxID=13288 RepID=A0AAU9S6Z5_THLAR|nr:unnamed protein product [Thlaspi arvense]
MVPSGNDELFLVERIIIRNGVLCFSKLACRVSKLDEKAGEWVVVTDLEERVFFIGQPGNSSCSAKELPDGCDTGNPEDDLSFWRSSRETCVTILNKSPMMAHMWVDAKP